MTLDELARYEDEIGRTCRLAFDCEPGNRAWVRQEYRHGEFVTMERHPVERWQTASIPEEVEEVPA